MLEVVSGFGGLVVVVFGVWLCVCGGFLCELLLLLVLVVVVVFMLVVEIG